MEGAQHGQESPKQRSRAASPSKNISSSKLVRSLSPTRVYSDDQKYKAALPDLFRQRGSLQLLHSLYLQDEPHSGLQSNQQRHPRLLSRLEELLAEKLAQVERAPVAEQGWASLQLLLDAHRQVFDAFLHSFTTYRPLLARIRREYDHALDDALTATHDNIHMRASLAQNHVLMAKAVQEAQERARARAKAVRHEVQQQLTAVQQQIHMSEQRFTSAESELQQLRSQMETAKKEMHQLTEHNRDMRRQLLSSCTGSLAGALAASRVHRQH